MTKASFITKPNLVDRFVLAWHYPLDLTGPGAQHGVTANATVVTYAGHIAQFPGPSPKAKIARGQGANRTDIGRIAGVVAIKSRIRIADNVCLAAPFLNGQNRIMGNFVLKAHTAGTNDTALHIEHN